MTMPLIFTPQTWLLLLPIISTVLLLLMRSKIQNKKHPPGPPKLPYIGNLHQLGPIPHHSLYQLSKTHGPVMSLQLGRVSAIVISSAEAAKQLLRDHDQDCSCRVASAGTRKMSYDCQDIAFSPYHHQWRELRRLLAVELFNTKKAQEFRHVREGEVSAMVDSIAGSAALDHSSVDLSERVFSMNASVVFKTAFGEGFDGSEIDTHMLHGVVEETEIVMGSFFASDFFPHVGWIVDKVSGLQGRLDKSFHGMDDFYQCVIDHHLDPQRRKPEQEDIVDVLLRIEGRVKETDSAQFTRDHTKAILMNVFLAGVTSSATLIIWAMAELARNPRIMKKAQTEVRNHIGNKGKVTEEDTDELQYLKMVIKESLRLHPPIPLLLSREVMSHFKLNGYDIHPETRVEINVWAIGRDPEKWSDPEEFYPERFEDSPVDYKGKHFELLPFGAGRRGCPGIYMGMALVELTLANLLYCFDWELPNGSKEEDMDMEESAGLTTPKKSPLELVPVKYELL